MITPELLKKYDRPVPRYTSYPTAPHFSTELGAQSYRQWLRKLDPADPLSLYLHIPFCQQLCWFCGCNTKVINRYEPVEAYCHLLLQELALVSQDWSGKRPLGHLHFGGGSPTLLEPKEIETLATAIWDRFEAVEGAELAVEFDPRGLKQETIQAFAELGINRASIGVQDLNPKVQAAINRIQTRGITGSAVERLRAAGIDSLNIDLVYGLPFQGQAEILATLDSVLELRPDRVALFGYAHVPHMKAHQKLILEEALPDALERARQAELAAERLVDAGYLRIGLDHFALPHDSLARAQIEDRLRRNFQGYSADRSDSLIGLGQSSIGCLPQGYIQNESDPSAYRRALADGRLPVKRGLELSLEDRLRRDIIFELMCNLEVNLEEVCARHGLPQRCFGLERLRLQELQEDGLVDLGAGRLRVREEGRVFLRLAAAAFDSYLGQGTAKHARAI